MLIVVPQSHLVAGLLAVSANNLFRNKMLTVDVVLVLTFNLIRASITMGHLKMNTYQTESRAKVDINTTFGLGGDQLPGFQTMVLLVHAEYYRPMGVKSAGSLHTSYICDMTWSGLITLMT